MTLKPPNLDDRDFKQLLDEAQRIIVAECPQWTDLTPGDPGIVLLELFAHLTETMIYRLNRLPEKAYVEFLRLLGVKLGPPAAAAVKLRFTLAKPSDKPVEIPRGTRVTVGRGGGDVSPVFVVAQTTTIPAGKPMVETFAYHAELIAAEDAGKGTGMPGFSITARRPPIVAATSDDLELVVGVEAGPDELTGRVRAIEYNGKAYAVWREAEDFSNLEGRKLVYVVDRITGTITFAPAVRSRSGNGELDPATQTLAAIPQAGREIRLWYWSGGGPTGNVAANTLTTLRDQIAGISVTNPDPANGGRAAETIENALVRGPQELHSLQRAVTASDFEMLARRSSGLAAASGSIARAKAFTKAMIWAHAVLGTIEVLLVPYIPEEQRPLGAATESALKAHQTEEALANIRRSLEERRPLGTTCLVNWVRYKNVRVEARAVIHRGEDAEAVKQRVLARLHQTINPLPSDLPSPGWSFGYPLRVSHVYDIMLAEPGVSFVDNVKLLVDEVPEKDISSIAADSFQPDTWYSTTHDELFRSMDNGEGWELINRFPQGEETVHIRVNTSQAGQVAAVTSLANGSSRLYVSEDCGETWRALATTEFAINDLAWTTRQSAPLVIIATDNGLFEVPLIKTKTGPVPIAVDSSRPSLGFTAVAASVGIRGTFFVAAAARSKNGVFLSNQSGASNTYTLIGGKDDDVRVLEVQQDGARTFLWSGNFIAGNEPPRGCLRWELRGAEPPGEGTRILKGWVGGSCHGLAFTNGFAYAATHEAGVLWLDLGKGDQASWHSPITTCGLPIRGQNDMRFHPVMAVAADVEKNIVMAGGPLGVFRSDDNGTGYQSCSNKVFDNRVTLPSMWLFVSGEHKVEVVNEDEAK